LKDSFQKPEQEERKRTKDMKGFEALRVPSTGPKSNSKMIERAPGFGSARRSPIRELFHQLPLRLRHAEALGAFGTPFMPLRSLPFFLFRLLESQPSVGIPTGRHADPVVRPITH
jgi:hypothetical protein